MKTAIPKKMQDRLIYMFFGFIVAAIGSVWILNLTQNSILAFFGFVAILAFWIGALTVAFKFKFNR